METIRDFHLENLLTSEIKSLVPEKSNRVLIPCGALEAHGAIGLGTDTIIPYGLAEALAPMLNALIAPPIPFGVLRSLSRYPGSVTLTKKLYYDLLMEICNGLIHSGFNEIIFLNGHSGNNSVIKDVAHSLHIENDVFAMVYDWYYEPDDITRKIYDGPGGHSGAGETGLVLTFRPEAAPVDLWKKEDAGTLNPAINAYPGPFPIILMEEDQGLPDMDIEKAKVLTNEVVSVAFKSINKVLDRWEELK
jgi:creatinine amidohydrolase